MAIEVIDDEHIDTHLSEIGPRFDQDMLEAGLFDNYASFKGEVNERTFNRYHETTSQWRAAAQDVCDAHDPEATPTKNFDECEKEYLEDFIANWREELVLTNVLNINRPKIECLDRIVTKLNAF